MPHPAFVSSRACSMWCPLLHTPSGLSLVSALCPGPSLTQPPHPQHLFSPHHNFPSHDIPRAVPPSPAAASLFPPAHEIPRAPWPLPGPHSPSLRSAPWDPTLTLSPSLPSRPLSPLPPTSACSSSWGRACPADHTFPFGGPHLLVSFKNTCVQVIKVSRFKR